MKPEIGHLVVVDSCEFAEVEGFIGEVYHIQRYHNLFSVHGVDDYNLYPKEMLRLVRDNKLSREVFKKDLIEIDGVIKTLEFQGRNYLMLEYEDGEI